MAVCGYKTIWKLVNKTTNVKVIDPEGVALRSAHRLRRRVYTNKCPHTIYLLNVFWVNLRLEPTLYSHVRKTVPPPSGHPLHKHFGKVNVTSRNSVEFHEYRTRNAVSSVHNAKVHDGHRSIKYHHEH
ncbi:hypothetical protein DPMN_001341 [Dreissena polymorpha]|uniref:Uncharacterized protein n=1 Tax=Dreissena polymorpha TaxID=45954 RepID=A0A9D4MIA5_DREPO|nr:hypothetical protein DPMN_001341 [Dreissena polymorpha]